MVAAPLANNEFDEFDDDCSEHVNIPPKRYYIGGFKTSITEDKIYRYVTKRGPSVTMVRIFKSKRNYGTVTIRLNVESNDKCCLLENEASGPDILCAALG